MGDLFNARQMRMMPMAGAFVVGPEPLCGVLPQMQAIELESLGRGQRLTKTASMRPSHGGFRYDAA